MVTVTDVSIRDCIDSDLPIFFEHQLDEVANSMIGSVPRDRENFIAHWQAHAKKPSVVQQTIVADQAVAGNIVSFEMAEHREVGYWLGKGFWGKGIATRALRLFLEKYPQRPLHAHAAKHNLGSIRVLEKHGFQIVGEDIRAAASSGLPTEEFVFLLEI